MAGQPTPKSYQQLLGDILATYLSKIGVNDLNAGSVSISFFETVAQAIYRASGDIFSILRDASVDRATGEALLRIAEEENVRIDTAQPATGNVTITDSSFNKISTKIYSGNPPPNIGSTSIDVSDASNFSSSGQLYIGRGTSNIEGPISYSSITNIGSYYRINLDTPTTKYHNNSETVILAQGGVRNIASGTVVKTVSAGSGLDISFSIIQAATILDGETTIIGVNVVALESGSDGNIPTNSIKEFISPPFGGATVTNSEPFTTGRNDSTDEEIRNKIKKARISKGLGTALAIKNGVIGIQAPDENAIVTSDEILSDSTQTTLFIDNGQALEEKSKGVGLEYIIDSALGGEQFFQLATGGSQTSIAKAALISNNTSPFAINPNDKLSILVGGILSEHTFQEGDFRSNGFVTAFEVSASINANSDLLFYARTIENGTKINLQSKSETNEFIQKITPTVGVDAGLALGIASTESQTLRIYKNNTPLNRNGRSAIIESDPQSAWSNSIASGDTLKISVDSTDPITYTITDNDFLIEGTYATVSNTNSLQSWVNVLNNKITGITASINGTQIALLSNLGANSRSKLEIDNTSTLVTKGMFNSILGLTSSGKEADFTLSRNTAQLKLSKALNTGDSLAAGSDFTEAKIQSSPILGGNVTLSSDADLWFIIDNVEAAIITHGVSTDSLVTVTKEASDVIRFRSNVNNAFGNVQAGDYVIIWSEELNLNNKIEGRVHGVGTSSLPNDYIEVKTTNTEWNAAVAEGPITFSEGLTFVRSDIPPQKISIAAGTYNINIIASNIQDILLGANVSTVDDEVIIISSKNKNLSDGSVLLVTQNAPSKNLNFTPGDMGNSNFSHYAFIRNIYASTAFPAFIFGSMADERSADIPTAYIPDFQSAINLVSLGIDPNLIVAMQNPYLSNGMYINDMQSYDETVQIDSIDSGGTIVNIDQSQTIRRIRVGDRFYLLNPLNFAYNDSITAVLDNNASDKTFPINLYRRAITNTTMPVSSNQFRAYDIDAGSTIEFSDFFGSSYSFKNYKALMQAKNIIDPNSAIDEDAILFRSAIWGRGGERYKIGYTYPAAANQSISSSILVKDTVDINVSLKSGASIPNNIDGTTQWDVTVANNTPSVGIEEASYTWNSTGTDPAMGTLMVGNYVTINSNGAFNSANLGTFRIVSATSTSFTVRKPNGTSVAETGISTLTTDTIRLYENSDTTAQEITTYVTDNLSNWITAELLNDNGSTGSGVISLSTYEDNSFVSDSDYIHLLDGINWISTSVLAASAPNYQFQFKNNLDLFSFDTNTPNAYSINNGEEIRFIPTTISQVVDFINTLAVSGFNTLGIINTALREQRLQLSTQILGSTGAIKISGGSANISAANIVGVANLIKDSDFIKVNVDKSVSAGIPTESWIKLEATNTQKKVTGFSFTTQATITPNDPTSNHSSILLANREITDRYFGQPRNNFRSRSRAFHVEKHGKLVNISWDGITGADPVFTKNVEINDLAAGNISISFNSSTESTEYSVTSGSINFSEVSIGDAVVIQNFVNTENNGTFNVNGISDDGLTLSVDNLNGVDAASAAISTGDIVITTGIEEGDSVNITSPFDILNQGRFRVIRRFNNSIYIDNPLATEERVVVSDNLRSLGFSSTTQFDVTVNGDMKIEWNTNGTAPTLINAKMGDELTIGTAFNVANRGIFMVTESGNNYLKVANAKAVAESAIVVTGTGGDVLECQIPAMTFGPYENTIVGDELIITGDVLSSSNQGTHAISEVLSKKQIVVSDILTAQSSVQFSNLFAQVFIQEGSPYVGYKKVYNKAVNPANSQRELLVFDSKNQYEKIIESANISATVQGKLGFTEDTIIGFDAYKYNTGLIRQANKTIYGDPRDPASFPGIAAAGAEIFINPPLIRKIQVSVSIRVKTGVPFTYVSEQVKNNIAALINSSPIGQPIAISDIVSTVNSVSGVTAVSISFPQFDTTHDVIVLNPSEKPFILDTVNDITVSKV